MSGLHARHQLREAVAGYLKSANIVAATSVLPHRRRPTADSQLPALMIFTEDEASGRLTREETDRRPDLVVRARVKSVGDPPQDALDALALAVERALLAAGSLGGLVRNLELVRTHSTESANSDRQAGDIDLVYAVEIHTAANDPAKIL